jgi:hypothetical protein
MLRLVPGQSVCSWLRVFLQVYHEEYANVELPVTCLQTLPAADTQPTDSLLCAGNFNSLLLLRDGKVGGVVLILPNCGLGTF